MGILSKKDLKKRRFKGWDYTELAEMWGLEAEYTQEEYKDNCFIEDERLGEAIKETIRGAIYWDNKKERDVLDNQIEADMRNYLLEVVRQNFFVGTSIYAALLSIDDALVFSQFYCVLLDGMWT